MRAEMLCAKLVLVRAQGFRLLHPLSMQAGQCPLAEHEEATVRVAVLYCWNSHSFAAPGGTHGLQGTQSPEPWLVPWPYTTAVPSLAGFHPGLAPQKAQLCSRQNHPESNGTTALTGSGSFDLLIIDQRQNKLFIQYIHIFSYLPTEAYTFERFSQHGSG